MKALRHGGLGKTGASIGALAVLFLTLVAPVHHVHALQAAFDQGGRGLHGASTDTGDCAAHGGIGHTAPHHGDRDDTLAHCPVCSLGKMVSALAAPSSPAINLPDLTPALPVTDAAASPVSARYECPAGPRAPPVQAR